MNRSAYLTTGYAIKAIERLSKARIGMHGKHNIPSGPIIFVINHFTRIETFVLPYYIYSITGVPVWSLGDAALFQGGFAKYFEMVGVVSTKDPSRDAQMVKALLSGEANWIIFPEGRMVKNKKIMSAGNFLVSTSQGLRKPHTGAASLALKTEILRKYIENQRINSSPLRGQAMDELGLESGQAVSEESTKIVPVNLTYYPIRAMENLAVNIANSFVNDLPERVVEELMIEGTMLLKGIDIDIRFGNPIEIDSFFSDEKVQIELEKQKETGFEISPLLEKEMYTYSNSLMQRYMRGIYKLTTVNHDHLFATFLRLYPYKKIKRADLCRRVYMAASDLQEISDSSFNLHRSLHSDQVHLVTDDRYKKVKNFLDLAVEKDVIRDEGEFLKINKKKLSAPLSVHRGRLDNPIEMMANEVEPLTRLYDILKGRAWQPDFLVRFLLAKKLHNRANVKFIKDYKKCHRDNFEKVPQERRPRLIPSWGRKCGVLLVHSYLSSPEEVKELGRYLARKFGAWVYIPRLSGHGTNSADLSKKHFRDWQQDVEEGYVILEALCGKVIVGGISVGGALALDLASRIPGVGGVFTLGTPYSLADFSRQFMPQPDRWDKLLSMMRNKEQNEQFLDYTSDNPHINYAKNPVSGVREVGLLLDEVSSNLPEVKMPVLTIHTDNDPVVIKKAAGKIYDNLGSEEKELCFLHSSQHIMTKGRVSDRVKNILASYIMRLSSRLF